MKQKESLAQKSVYWLKVISLGLILGFGIQFAQAWTSPAAAPPGGNVSGPLTTSGIGQIKAGNLALNTDGIYANALLIPSGNVGIGTINPTEKLDVNGNVKATGVLTAGKVQIVDVVVENTDCAPMGLVARDNTGILLSCQGSPLKWKKASGGGGDTINLNSTTDLLSTVCQIEPLVITGYTLNDQNYTQTSSAGHFSVAVKKSGAKYYAVALNGNLSASAPYPYDSGWRQLNFVNWGNNPKTGYYVDINYPNNNTIISVGVLSADVTKFYAGGCVGKVLVEN